jgi:hypothetical protein
MTLPALSEDLHLLLARSPVFLVVVAVCQFCILVCAAGAEDTLVPVIGFIVNYQLRCCRARLVFVGHISRGVGRIDEYCVSVCVCVQKRKRVGNLRRVF